MDICKAGNERHGAVVENVWDCGAGLLIKKDII